MSTVVFYGCVCSLFTSSLTLFSIAMNILQNVQEESKILKKRKRQSRIEFKHLVDCFGDDLQPEYYVFCWYFHVTKCFHLLIARLVKAYLDKPGIEWSLFRYQREKNTVLLYYEAVTVWWYHRLVVADGRSDRESPLNDEWVDRHGVLHEVEWYV